MLLFVLTALAAPKTLTVVDDPRIPTDGTVPSALTEHAVCVRPSPGKLASVVPCPAADPLFAATREGLARDLPARPNDQVLGIVRAMGSGWVAVDTRVTGGWQYGRAQLGSASREELDALAGWCRSDRDAQLVTELHVGCARVSELGGLPAGATLKLKDIAGTMSRVGAGDFVSEGAKESTCGTAPEVVFVRAVSKHELCSTEVWPALMRRGEEDLQSFKASPDAVAQPVRSVLGDLAESAVALEGIHRRLTNVDASLTQSRLDLAGVREQVTSTATESDSRFVTLLTRLDELDADLSETTVSAGSAQEHARAYDLEESALAEKAAETGLDAMQIARLGSQLRDLIARLEALSQDVAAIEERVAAARQGVGYLQGGLLAVQPAAKGTKGR